MTDYIDLLTLNSISSFICFVFLLEKWVAIKVLENIKDNIEEIEEEFLVLRDLCLHPNIPAFYDLYLKRGASSDDDQLWFVMEVVFIDIILLLSLLYKSRFSNSEFFVILCHLSVILYIF